MTSSKCLQKQNHHRCKVGVSQQVRQSRLGCKK